MSLKSIKIQNLLSFDSFYISKFEDLNCIIGRNNVGKSNLLKLIKYFYQKLEGEKVLPPELQSRYSLYGSITISYDLTFLMRIITADKNTHIGYFQRLKNKFRKYSVDNLLTLELYINSDDSIKWSIEDRELRVFISDIFPFFDIPSRYIEPKDWSKLWYLVSRLKPFNPHNVKADKVKDFFDGEVNDSSYKTYSRYVETIEKYLEIDGYKHSDKVLNFVKSGLKGDSFLIDSKKLETESDGTNTYKFLESFLTLMIALTRRSYISPIVFIDEPELGFHPKRSEEFIESLFNIFKEYNYKRPYPNILLTTHSPNIVKQVIKLFTSNHKVLHFSKNKKENSVVNMMNSRFDDERFLNIFGDNEARLFFSRFILFVEGETELEIFGNQKLKEWFPVLKKIDVYKSSSNVLGENLNPSYNNTSIPYLYLFDADKFIDIDIVNKKLNLKNEIIKWKDLQKRYKKSYVSSTQNKVGIFLDELLKWEKSSNNDLVFEKNIYIKNIKYDLITKYLNQYFLNHENYNINKTTVEEVLVNKDTLDIFIKWIKISVINDIKLSYLDVPLFKKKIGLQRKKLNQVNQIKKFISCNSSLKDNLLVVLILLFNGKTETLISLENKSFDKLEQTFQMELRSLKNLIDKNSSFLYNLMSSKTSGWTTKFLNFTISEIESKLTSEDLKEREKEFRKVFQQNFGELFDTIKLIEKSLADR